MPCDGEDFLFFRNAKSFALGVQVELHGLHVEEALQVLEQHLFPCLQFKASQFSNFIQTVRFMWHMQVDLHGLHVEEALQVLEQHLLSLGGLGCPGGVLLQVLPL